VGDGYTALRLLCTTNKKAANALAYELSLINTERKDLTHNSVSDAKLQVGDQENSKLLIVASRTYHEGVIGLVAGRLAEQYRKPAIAIAIGETEAKGSARSIRGINIVDIIREVRKDLLSVGGHPLAAGFSLLSSKLELVVSSLQTVAQEKIDENLLLETKRVECVLSHGLVTIQTAEALEQFEPFGMGNPRPRFLLRGIKIIDIQSVGKSGKHCKLLIQLSTEKRLPVLWWNCGEIDQNELAATTELAVKLEINNWQGKRSLQGVV